jgi:phosphoribosyl 1,2-cyclic phosphodiesterase
MESIKSSVKTPMDFRLFATGDTIELGDMAIETFSVPHDAQDPVGYLVQSDQVNLGVVTDLGHVTKLVIERMRKANILVLESNHDIKMLQDNPYRPWSLKQRILSRHGHLSNEAAAEAMETIVSENLRHLYLGHISRDCNRADIALEVMTKRMEKAGATHIQISAASPSGCSTLEIPF